MYFQKTNLLSIMKPKFIPEEKRGRKRRAPRHTFGEWLYSLRIRRGMTQQQVASELAKRLDRSDLPISTISCWENTGDLGGRFTIPALADVLGVSIETLLRVERMPNGKYSRTDWNPRIPPGRNTPPRTQQ